MLGIVQRRIVATQNTSTNQCPIAREQRLTVVHLAASDLVMTLLLLAWCAKKTETCGFFFKMNPKLGGKIIAKPTKHLTLEAKNDKKKNNQKSHLGHGIHHPPADDVQPVKRKIWFDKCSRCLNRSAITFESAFLLLFLFFFPWLGWYMFFSALSFTQPQPSIHIAL